MAVTWRNPTSVSSTDPHVSTQQRLRYIFALTRVVTNQFHPDCEVKRRDASSQKVLSLFSHTASKNLTHISVIWTILPRFLSTLLFVSPHLPQSLSMCQKSFQTPMRHGVLSHPSDSQALKGTCHASACPRTKDNCDLDKQ